MIERHWKGLAKKEMSSSYIDHLMNDTFTKLSSMSGFVSSSILRREVPEGTEFLIVTRWTKLEDIKNFAGEDVSKAVVPEFVQAMMVRYDEVATHYTHQISFPAGNESLLA